MSTSISPVHVSASLDPGVSRWQWLFKWLLVIPHYVVLALLWIAFVVLSVVAFFAILVTGRYPRSMFDFNVGVLRWTWRVTYYAYGALATDQYPPFTLRERSDYPAHLEIDYPEHLSRGLVLVKSWLLAIPHYLVLALFLGGSGYAVSGAGQAAGEAWVFSVGLIGVLVAVAAVVLLFTGRYPQSVFDLVLGLNRWVLRVAAYVALMTDRYPPFRLDQGGPDPAIASFSPDPATPDPASPDPTSPVPTTPVPTSQSPSGGASAPHGPSTPTGAPPPPGSPRAGGSGWTAGPITAVVIGSLVVAGALGLGGIGVTLAVVEATMRDDDGFVMVGEEDLTTDTYALLSSDMVIELDDGASSVPDAVLGDMKITASPLGDEPLFVGLAPTADVQRYLGDVRHDTVEDLFRPDYRTTEGGSPSGPPAAQGFWTESSSGAGEQTVVWELREGDWTVVVMNADATGWVEARATAGAELPVLEWIVAVLLILAAVGIVVGAVAIALAVRAAGRS
jgi:hypothetical protein